MDSVSKRKARVRPHAGKARENAGAFHSHAYISTRPTPCQYIHCTYAPAHGRVQGDVWAKAARASAHMLKAPRAWAMDRADLDAAERLGIRFVHVKDLEKLADYWACVRTIRAKGFGLDRGHGQQVALALEHWRPTRAQAVALARELAVSEPVGVQASLWRGGGQ